MSSNASQRKINGPAVNKKKTNGNSKKTGTQTTSKKSRTAVNNAAGSRSKNSGNRATGNGTSESKGTSSKTTDNRASGSKNTGSKATGSRTSGSKAFNSKAVSNEKKMIPVEPQSSRQKLELKDEIYLLTAMGITVLLCMCNFHLCMGVGEFLYYIMHGLFGCLAYIFPFAALWSYMFMVSNRGNREAKPKMILVWIIFVQCCCLTHLATVKASQPISLIHYMTNGQSGFNGGVIGGLIAGVLQHMVGTFATFLIVTLTMVITFVLLTERSVIKLFKEAASGVQNSMAESAEVLKTLPAAFKEKIKTEKENENRKSSEKADAYEYSNGEYDDEYDDSYDEYDDEYDDSYDEYDDEYDDSCDEYDADSCGYEKNRDTDKFLAFDLEDAKRKRNEFLNQDFTLNRSDFDKNPNTAKSSESFESEHLRADKNIFSKTSDAMRKSDAVETPVRKPFGERVNNGENSSTRTVSERTNPVVTPVRRPGSGYKRQVWSQEAIRLSDMGFSDLLQSNEETESADSIDDYIVYNGVASVYVDEGTEYEETSEETPYEPHEKTSYEEPDYDRHENWEFDDSEADGDDLFEMEAALTNEPFSNKIVHLSGKTEAAGESDLSDESDFHQKISFIGERKNESVSDDNKDAIDLTENVKLPEDGPVFRETASRDSVYDKNISHAKTDQSSIWKETDQSGNRGSSGAVTFSTPPVQPAKPKPAKKKPYIYPKYSLLEEHPFYRGGKGSVEREIQDKLKDTLESFGVEVTMGEVSRGPSVTRYELEPKRGVKVSRIMALQDDIKLALAAADIRIEAPIPGKSAIGIEIPNRENSIVGFRELIASEGFKKHPSKVAVAVGRDISGNVVIADLAKMPHLLIAGATGSGKSVCINTLIMSLLYKASPEEVKLVLVDPKVVELSVYNGIPHLLIPVVTDARKAANALRWAVDEMNDRYKKFAEFNVRNLEGYNERLKELKEQGESVEEEPLYQMVIIVDELADLMMVAQNEVEEAICRLAQMARAAGIHLVLATQRPSVNVITGLIKANVPSRIAFAVSSGVDSRTIIDMNGAEKLLGKGDMLFYPYGVAKPYRVQGAFISDHEVSEVVAYLHKRNGEVSGQEMMEKMIISASENSIVKSEQDEHFESAARFIIEKDKASIGALQRNFKIGFNRAARLMDQLAAAGIVGEEEGTKPRKILMNMEELEAYLNS